MNTHVKLVAALHIAFGAMGLVAAMIVFAIFGTGAGIVVSQGETGPAAIIGIVALCICGLILLCSVPDIIGGWALLAQKSWGRTLMIVLGILDLLSIPLGTILGIYTLWALLRDEQAQAAPVPVCLSTVR